MTQKRAIDILIALAVCSVSGLYCADHCPLCNESEEKIACDGWTDGEVAEAVETILAAREGVK